MIRSFIIVFLVAALIIEHTEHKTPDDLPARCPAVVGSKELINSTYDLRAGTITCNYVQGQRAYGSTVWKSIEPIYYRTDKE